MTRGDVSKETDVVIPSITDAQAAVISEAELAQREALATESTLPREFHPKAIKKEYRLKAILWSALLAIVMITGMMGDKNKWGSMVPNLLRMMSGQATETAGLPDQEDSSTAPKSELPPTTSETPPPEKEAVSTPEDTMSIERLVYPAANLVDDESLCRNSNGSYKALVEPIVVDGIELFRITVVPVDINGRNNIDDLMLGVLDPSERVYDAAKCLAGMPNGENEMTYYIPANQSEKASETDTSTLKLIDRNNFYYYFPGLVMVDEQGNQHIEDEGALGIFTFKNPSGEYTNTAIEELIEP